MVRDREASPELIAQWERLGAPQVRLLMETGGYEPFYKREVLKWLKDKDDEAKKREDDDRALQTRIALSSKKAAWAAFWISVIALIVSLVALLSPR